MRIVYFLPDIEAGVSKIVKNLLKFRPFDRDLTYAVVLIRRNDQTNEPAADNFNADEIIRFNYREEENAFSVFKRLSKTIKSENDIIVGNDGFEIKMVATQKLKNPVIYILHGDFSYYYSILKHYGSVIDRIITYSDKMQIEAKAIVGEKAEKIYYPSDAVLYTSQLIKKSRKSIVILFAGHLDKRKGTNLLPAIYKNLKTLGLNNFLFVIAGSGPEEAVLKAELENEENVLFTGWISSEEIHKNFEYADIFVFPTTSEGLPNVIIEALVHQAVPVVSDVESGIPDLISHNINGCIVEVGNSAKFASAIYDLATDSNKLLKMREANRETLQFFEPTQQAFKYQNSIIKILENKDQNKQFPIYKRGRILDLKWLPNWLVIIVRSTLRWPKL